VAVGFGHKRCGLLRRLLDPKIAGWITSLAMRPLLGILLLGLAACESVSSEKIEQWKGTQKGPPKIEEALRSSGVAPGLRAEAAAALGDLGMPEKVDEVMAALPADQRWEILKSLVPIHIKAMESAPVPNARDARDGLFSVRAYAQPEQQKRSTSPS